MNLENILFIDTESNPASKKPECISWLKGHEKGIIENFDNQSYNFLKNLWDSSDGVIFFNAPYDLGALSIFYSQNHYEWVIKNINNEKSASWKLSIFDNIYDVRRISFFRNMIKNQNRNINGEKSNKHRRGIVSTPIIDMLKLWSILISDDDISLKSLIKKELHKIPIEYSEKNARTEAYRYQDIICLKELTGLFFEKIKNINEVRNFTISDWSYIKTPATFTKILYKNHYKYLLKWKEENDVIILNMGLYAAVESAFHGGITLSMHRGEIKNGGWFDIKGAYAKAIETLNTDKYLKFDIERVDNENLNFDNPFLCRIKTNFIMTSINKSLKLFYVDEPTDVYIWNFDIIACKNLSQNYSYELIEVYEIIPKNNIEKSLPVEWNIAKNNENKLHGKTTLYQFYKFLSNTSYGIKAQRKPFQTPHTNMVIAGMITSKVHQILSIIVKTLSDNGFENKYNDTDSAFVCPSEKMSFSQAADIVNKNIHPFEVEFEGSYEKTIILSLKRYISIKHSKPSKEDKIKLHGKGRYKISVDDIREFVLTQKCSHEYLKLSQISGNTELSITQILNLFPFLDEYKHPFMFEKNIKTDKLKEDFFNEWYYHIDTKTSWDMKKTDFSREFHHFKDVRAAQEFFKNFSSFDNDNCTGAFRSWDNEISEDFKKYTN